VGRRAIALVAVAVLLFAALLGAMSNAGLGSANLDTGLTSQVMTTAVTLCALLLLGLVVMIVWSLLSRPGDVGKTRMDRANLWVIILIPIVFALIAGLIGLIVHPHVIRHNPFAGQHPLPGARTPNTTPRPSKIKFETQTAEGTIGVVVAVVVIVMVAGWVAHRRLRRTGRFSWLEATPGSSVFDTSSSSSSSELASTLAAVEVPDPKQEPDPRRAVIAAYLAMTRAAAAADHARAVDETPAEFLQRLLFTLGVSVSGASNLTRLFERARYSSMPVDESLRTDAIFCLAEVEGELRAFAGTGQFAGAT
jgi:hypothetical protein